MDYREALAYLYSFADYERLTRMPYGPAAMNLPRTERLLARLGDPHQAYPIIHIAGTKGKGSTAALVAAALQAAGYRVGLYTQPHLHTYRERIRINGCLISPTELADLVAAVRPHVEAVHQTAPDLGRLTTYEIGTALALWHFARQRVDIAVLEVGLGGRLDATNVVTPTVAAITLIGYDHTQVLGNTLAAIAGEKAGIIKPGGVVVSAPQPAEALAVIAARCRERRARLVLVGYDTPLAEVLDGGQVPGRPYQVVRLPGLGQQPFPLPLLGAHQAVNAAVASAILAECHAAGIPVPPSAIRAGFARVAWPARLEILAERPLVVADGAHNLESARALARALTDCCRYRRLFLVLAILADKDIPAIARALVPLAEQTIVTRTAHPRAAAPETILAALPVGARAATAPSVAEALEVARAQAGPDDLICVTGSLSAAAEARTALGRAVESD
jgi:dihydrofolate synthase/folylpolyglutamate synthase